MNFRLILYVFCFGAFVSSFTPCFIQCMEREVAATEVLKDSLGKTSPMDIDPDCLTDRIDQVVGNLTVSGNAGAESEAIVFHVNNTQELEIAFGHLIGFLKEGSPDANKIAEPLILELVRGIEKIYDSAPNTVREIVKQNRDKLDPDLQRVFDCCLDKCRDRMSRFANCHACSIYASVALFSFVIYFALQEFYL